MKNFKIMMLLAGFSSMVMTCDKPYDSTERQADKEIFDDVTQVIATSPTVQRVVESVANYGTVADHKESDKALVDRMIYFYSKGFDFIAKGGKNVATAVQDTARKALKVVDVKAPQDQQEAQNQPENKQLDVVTSVDGKTDMQKIQELKLQAWKDAELRAQLYAIKDDSSLSRDEKIAAAVTIYDTMNLTDSTLTSTMQGQAVHAIPSVDPIQSTIFDFKSDQAKLNFMIDQAKKTINFNPILVAEIMFKDRSEEERAVGIQAVKASLISSYNELYPSYFSFYQSWAITGLTTTAVALIIYNYLYKANKAANDEQN